MWTHIAAFTRRISRAFPATTVLVTLSLVCGNSAASAEPISLEYTTGGFFQDNIGNIGFPNRFDILSVEGYSSPGISLEPGTSTIAPLNSFSFSVGLTGLPEVNPVPLSISRAFFSNLTGVTNITQNAEVLIGFEDQLTIFGGQPLQFHFPSFTLLITPLPVSVGPIGIGGTVESVIDGRFEVRPVPEPGTLLLLGIGLVGVASARRWRQRNPS